MFEHLLKRKPKILDLDAIAKLLQTDKEALQAFEAEYQTHALNNDDLPDNYFEINAKQMANHMGGIETDRSESLEQLIDQIVKELKTQTRIYQYDPSQMHEQSETQILPQDAQMALEPIVKPEAVNKLPLDIRPALTGYYVQKSIQEDSYPVLLTNYEKYLKEKNPKKKQMFYHLFRQGLDILDVDCITNEIIGMNPNSMGNWFLQLVEANQGHNFFKIPKTMIAKLPTTILQLTRMDYLSFNRTTLDIIDRYCQDIFDLDENATYFIKTGVASSKFDFRNAKVTSPKEVRELGEYLLFIHNQDCQMASPLNNITIYGKGTTNEWVVREFIEDKEENPCIYKGLPLHTEYRVFADFDTCEILGMTPYWEPSIMKKRFEEQRDGHDLHDYVIFEEYKDTLMKRYQENKDLVKTEVEKLLPDCNLNGQWSIDIMQNGTDFWLIDMATANTSALSDCIPPEKRKSYQEDWLPKIK